MKLIVELELDSLFYDHPVHGKLLAGWRVGDMLRDIGVSRIDGRNGTESDYPAADRGTLNDWNSVDLVLEKIGEWHLEGKYGDSEKYEQ